MTVLSYTNAFPGIPFPNKGSGNSKPQSYLYPGAVQPQKTAPSVLSYLNAFPNGICGRYFPGGYNAINIASGFSISTPFSISAWVYTAGSGFRALIGAQSAGGVEFRIDSANTVTLLAENQAALITSVGTVTPGVWTLIGVSYDGTNTAVYIGGSQDSTGTAAHGITSALSYQFGLNVAANGEYYQGGMADFAVWNTILTAPQFAALATARANTVASGSLIGYWPTLDGDQSGNHNNASQLGSGANGGTYLVRGPSVLTTGIPFPQHGSGLTNTVLSYLYPGAVQPIIFTPTPPSNIRPFQVEMGQGFRVLRVNAY